MIETGAAMPDFRLPDDGGGEVAADDLKGRPYVLYLYPKDDTPGCTKESLAFADLHERFAVLPVRLLGLSKDDVASHAAFKAKHGLPFTLLADEECRLVEALGSWVEKSMYGKKYMGIERSTFLVDGEGRVRRAWRDVKVQGHGAEVLAEAERLVQNGV